MKTITKLVVFSIILISLQMNTQNASEAKDSKTEPGEEINRSPASTPNPSSGKDETKETDSKQDVNPDNAMHLTHLSGDENTFDFDLAAKLTQLKLITPSLWSVTEVLNWLDKVLANQLNNQRIAEIKEVFSKNEIDGNALEKLTEAQDGFLGLSKDELVIIKKALAEFDPKI